MAPHVCPERISAGMWYPFPGAIQPLAAVLLRLTALSWRRLAATRLVNVLVVQMRDQIVHVPQVTGLTAIPFADGDLVRA